MGPPFLLAQAPSTSAKSSSAGTITSLTKGHTSSDRSPGRSSALSQCHYHPR